jgi:hypothetical protein
VWKNRSASDEEISQLPIGRVIGHVVFGPIPFVRFRRLMGEGRSPAGCDTLPMFDVLKAQKRRPAMKKISTMQVFGNEIFKEQKLSRLTGQ